MQITNKKKPEPFMAKIKRWQSNEEITVHFAENEEQWKNGVMRIDIDGKSAEIMPDVLISAYMTAYNDTSILDIARRPLISVLLRIKSWYYAKWRQ